MRCYYASKTMPKTRHRGMQNSKTHRDNSMFHKLHSGFPHKDQHMSRAMDKPHPGNNT